MVYFKPQTGLHIIILSTWMRNYQFGLQSLYESVYVAVKKKTGLHIGLLDLLVRLRTGSVSKHYIYEKRERVKE